MYYLEGKVAYVLNPKYNLRNALGGILSQEHNSQFEDRTSMLTNWSPRNTFRDIYNDLASYKTHIKAQVVNVRMINPCLSPWFPRGNSRPDLTTL